MKLKFFQQFFSAFAGALLAVALIWVVPGAQAAVTRATRAAEQPIVADSLLAETRVLSYQGRLLNPAANKPQPDGAYSIKFSLYASETGGTALWTETKSVSVSSGLFSTLLGTANLLNLANFNGQDLWLGVAVGTDPEAAPRQRVAHVAYALHSDTSNSSVHAANADFATTADYASNSKYSDEAVTASTADHALQADNATNANFATTAANATNATNATNANNASLLGGFSPSSFYRGSNFTQVYQTTPLAAGGNEYWFTFGYAADQMVYWRVKPTTVGAKMRVDVEIEYATNNTVTYWLRVYNTGSTASGYQLVRYMFTQ